MIEFVLRIKLKYLAERNVELCGEYSLKNIYIHHFWNEKLKLFVFCKEYNKMRVGYYKFKELKF